MDEYHSNGSKVIVALKSLPILSLVVVEKGLCVDQHRDNDVSLAAFDQIRQSYSHWELWFGHVKDLVFDILDVETAFLH